MPVKKILIGAMGGAFFAVAGVVLMGWYPIALVDGSPIFFSTWRTAEQGAQYFFAAQQRRAGRSPINLSDPANAALAQQIKKNSLTFLIEDRLIAGEGERLISGFDAESKKRVDDAARGAQNLAASARYAYHFSFADFERLVLLPQARRDIIQQALAARGATLDKWLEEIKKTKHVVLMFTPFAWDGAEVQ